MSEKRRADAGQSSVLLLAVMMLSVLMMVATARFGARLVQLQQARIAADAAALAGTVAGRPAAARMAAANGGELRSFLVADGVVSVVVSVGAMSVTARATRAP